MSKYKVTEKVTNLIEKLFDAGYEGEATFTNRYCTGTAEYLDGAFSIQLSGFSKETLHVVENTDTGEVEFIGRYNFEAASAEPTVELIVEIAANMYDTYKDRGYSMPFEFRELFKKQGYLTEQTVTREVFSR